MAVTRMQSFATTYGGASARVGLPIGSTLSTHDGRRRCDVATASPSPRTGEGLPTPSRREPGGGTLAGVVLVLAAVDAAAGVYLLAHSVRRGGAAERWVGVILVVCGLGLGSTPWLTDEEPLPSAGRSAGV